jgi:hypothetical protein
MTGEPVLDKLARFTPASVGFDRDALIFAAGRASATKARGWKLMTLILAGAQAATLAVWLSGWQGRQARHETAAEDIGTNKSDGTHRSQEMPEPGQWSVPAQAPHLSGSYASLLHGLERGELPDSRPIDDPVPAQPILTVSSRDVPSS